RGQAGDAEEALRCFQQSLEIAEDLQRANPGSAAAARDVSVSLERLGGFYLARGQAGDAEEALRCFQKSLELREQLQRANPGSAAAARDVSVSLNKLGDFYLARGQAGDAEEALRCFQQSLELREQLQRANPGSAAAARDLLISRERMSAVLSKQPSPEAPRQALEYQLQAVEVAEGLYEQNPGSAYFGQTAARSWFLVFHRAQAAGDEPIAAAALNRCYQVLSALIAAGIVLDGQLVGLHSQLQDHFGSSET
ncbi:MAG: tetratricopeptide repeat protein, partial [Pirellulales bacterium]|nr:tetratricopeptide repeat protein [Pirellulales bacterium]